MKTVITKIEKQTRMMMLTLACIFTLLTTVNNVYAQVPQTIPYQAVARDNSGNIIANQNISLRFTIHDLTAVGAIVYRETHTATTSALGLFSVSMGSGTLLTGPLATVNWGTGAKFIQVEMDPAGGAIYTDMGTTQLMSVPYALFAGKSSDMLSGTATGNTMHWNGTAWVEDNTLYNDGTNVGIGTSSPDAKLHVAGNIKIADGSQGAGKVLTSDADGLASWTTPTSGSGSGWGLNGNNGTNSSTDFIGTTDAQPLVLKVNNFKSGLIDYDASSANTGLGYQALSANIAGASNTATGYLALSSNTYGGYNIANGATALYNNNFGFYNVAVGCSTLYNNSGGSNNIAIGYNALFSNTTAQNNVAIGPHTLNNTSGSSAGFNTAVGYGALFSNVACYNATAIGARAMYYANNSASGVYNFNVALGYEALRGSNTPANNTGNWNTALGYSTLLNNTSGNYNIAVGPNALSFNTTGNHNIGIGYNALFFNTTGLKNVATGYQALISNDVGNENVATGYQALLSNTGNDNTAIGYSAGSNITSGSNNVTVGSNAQVPTANADNQVRIGNASISYAGVQVAWTITSDRRWKSDIKESELGLDFVSKLRPVSYYRNNDESRKREFGFIAQELEETLNASGAADNGIISKDDDGMYGVRYNDLIAPMVKAIQELSKENKELKVANASFKTDIENIKAQLEMQVKAGNK